ncbi:PEP/pyruvate-binding domain-containing protein [Rhodococcus sp. IEGM 1305]|uniref:PEP/pyruvate-binding domain-containing protein n=1 Tax=Rhodococcus sp. IEGM 1305 TaxID=3047092 RepID=UPI0024B7B56C|nr:PEP/pyruvate-binding domain-containing protein [Rhodococcus sp. IEGM 1305]MDI9953635.1 PEP/pyruvate-binding domain-containing protein [Rhodococcus sp. IEGM 1305]
MQFTYELSECSQDKAPEIGGKALGLGMLWGLELDVPPGFVITTAAYRASVSPDLIDEFNRIAASAKTVEELQLASKQIAEHFSADLIAPELRAEILERYAAIADGNSSVAVRSSATAEDRADASFAGQQETYLWVRGADDVLDHVARCWASLYTAQAISYRRRLDDELGGLAMAVVVQQMVPAQAGGVMMTIDPATGNSSAVYVEAALGLAEGVVRGDVISDSFWVDRSTSDVRSDIRVKDAAHVFDTEVGRPVVRPVTEEAGRRPAISDDEARKLAAIGMRVEVAQGIAQDIEWAIAADGDGRRRLYLLQARPETVWSRLDNDPNGAVHLDNDPLDPGETNLFHGSAGRDGLWTITNMQEAIPGVSTPLTSSVWLPVSEFANRNHYRFIGALTKEEAKIPADSKDWVVGLFYGRAALRLDYYASWADRVPGLSGEAIIGQFFSSLPDTLTSRARQRNRLRAIPRLPLPFLVVPRRMRQNRTEVGKFWSAAVSELATADRARAVDILAEGVDRFQRSLALQVNLTQGAFQSLSRVIRWLCKGTSVNPHELVAGYGGHEESALVDDLWACSRRELTLEQFIRRHGYHGWREGELSNHSWREDPSMIEQQLGAYRQRPDDEDPRVMHSERADKRRELERRLLSELASTHRIPGRFGLALAAHYLPMRGVSKVSFLQGLDVVRAAARRLGALLAQEGKLNDAEDVFYLTLDELKTGPENSKAVVAERKILRRRYEQIELPDAWQGIPEPLDATAAEALSSLEGTPASPGVVEGRARVVLNPADARVEDGEILVARDTDPAWAPLIFLSSALVADIGGVMSHTAVVARELGIPCVVNTKVASLRIKTGDLIRVNGATGLVEILDS